MGRRPKQTFFLRRHTDGQQVHEKMLNITNYQRNANQNYNEVSPHTSKNGHHQMSTNNKCWKRCGEKGNPPTLLVGMYIGAATMENSMGVP